MHPNLGLKIGILLRRPKSSEFHINSTRMVFLLQLVATMTSHTVLVYTMFPQLANPTLLLIMRVLWRFKQYISLQDATLLLELCWGLVVDEYEKDRVRISFSSIHAGANPS